MRSTKYGSLAVLAFAVMASEVAAQARTAARPAAQRQAASTTNEGSWELGQDLGLSIGVGDPKTLTLTIPTLGVRAGYYVTEALSLEPQLFFTSTATENQTGFSFWMLQLGGLYHLSPSRTQGQWFIHPGIAFTGGSGGGPNFTVLSATFGMKRPMLAGRLAMRAEAGLAHQLKEGVIDAETSVIANFGWSVYTR